MVVIDAQVHTYEANTPARPWRMVPDWPPQVTGDDMVAALDAVAVDGAIIVSPFTMYGYDASYAQQVQRAHPGRFALVKPVDPDDPAVEDVITAWKATPGAVGIRVLMGADAPRDPAHPGLARTLRTAARLDLPVNLHCWGTLDAAATLLDRYTETRFVIDHLGTVQPFVPPVPASAWSELPQVLALARRPNAVIKVTGACTLARLPFPFDDIWTPLARIFDAWGIERCLWGTDCTRALALVSHAQSVQAFQVGTRLTGPERAQLMGESCARTYGWRPQRRLAAKA